MIGPHALKGLFCEATFEVIQIQVQCDMNYDDVYSMQVFFLKNSEYLGDLIVISQGPPFPNILAQSDSGPPKRMDRQASLGSWGPPVSKESCRPIFAVMDVQICMRSSSTW